MSGGNAKNGGNTVSGETVFDGRTAPDAPLSPYHCSVHLHTTLCDGQGTPEEMAAAAYRAGVRHLGFSGHSHTPLPADAGYVMSPDLTEYRRRILDLRRQYAGRMEVLLGIEWDLYADTAPAPWMDGSGFDYWIGSVHHVRLDGADCPVDNSAACFQRSWESAFGGDVYAFAEAYYRAVAEIAARKPTILGHIDLFTKFNEQGEFFDASAPRYRRAALDALHTADPASTLLEINTGAMSRGYRSAPYPAAYLLGEWRRMGGRVIVTADSHSPDTLLYGYDSAMAAARAAGFLSAAVLTAAGVREVPL